MTHVLTVVGGYGVRVIPHAPFRARIASSGSAVEVERANGKVRVSADGHGQPQVDCLSGRLDEVVDVVEGPQDRRWLLQTSRVTLAFPSGYTLTSVPDGSISPFDLLGEHEELIYIQGVRAAVSTSQLVADGQMVTEQSGDLVEVSYEHDDRSWCQRHQIIRLDGAGTFALTVQAPAERMGPARVALDEMARSARPT